jgi:hypothetical protein
MVSEPNKPEATEADESPIWENSAPDFVLLQEIKPPRRIELARERMLLSRLYLGLIQTINDDYGAEFAKHSDSATYRTIGIYVFLRTCVRRCGRAQLRRFSRYRAPRCSEG